jgi:hypothetical protein
VSQRGFLFLLSTIKVPSTKGRGGGLLVMVMPHNISDKVYCSFAVSIFLEKVFHLFGLFMSVVARKINFS